MSCCEVLIKYIVFLFNFVLVLTSVALIGIGAFIQINMTKYFDFLGNTYLNTSIILIIIGALMLMVSFFGCCGACQKNPCIMYTYGTMLTLILVSLIGVASAVYVYRTDARDLITKTMTESLKNYKREEHEGNQEESELTHVDESAVSGFGGDYDYDDEYYDYSEDEEEEKEEEKVQCSSLLTWDNIQKEFECCGVNNFTDWEGTPAFNETNDVPDSCCKNITLGCGKGASDTNKIYKTGCFIKFEGFVVDNVATVGGVGVGVIILLLLGICVSCYVARGLGSKRSHGRLPY